MSSAGPAQAQCDCPLHLSNAPCVTAPADLSYRKALRGDTVHLNGEARTGREVCGL